MITQQCDPENSERAAPALPEAARGGCIRLLWQVVNLLIEHRRLLSTTELATLDMVLLRMLARADHWTIALVGSVLLDMPDAAPHTTQWLAQRKPAQDDRLPQRRQAVARLDLLTSVMTDGGEQFVVAP